MVKVLTTVSKVLQDSCSFLSTASLDSMYYHDAGLPVSVLYSLLKVLSHGYSIQHLFLPAVLPVVSAAQLKHFLGFPELLE